MILVLLLAHQPERVAARPVRAELRLVVCAENKRVTLGERDVLLERGLLAEVVTAIPEVSSRSLGRYG